MKFSLNLRLVALALLASVAFTACNDDPEQIERETNNSFSTVDVTYSLQVVNGSNSSFGKTQSAIEGATVTIVDASGVEQTATVPASGIVAFTGLRLGLVSVVVNASGFYTTRFTVDLTEDFNGQTQSGAYQTASIIALFPSSGNGTATIQGTLEAELDLSEPGDEPVVGRTVLLYPAGDFVSDLGINDNIENVTVDGFPLSATTGANGNFSFTVPGSVNQIIYDLKMPEFETFITLADSTTDTTATLFSSFGTSTSVRTGETQILELAY